MAQQEHQADVHASASLRRGRGLCSASGQSGEYLTMDSNEWIPISHENCGQVDGPFYHGTKAKLAIGGLLISGYASNFEEGRVSNHIYFSTRLEAAIWGAELATSLAGLGGRGYIYIVTNRAV